MKVIEEFVTLQGEGRFVGTPSFFIRTTGCNLRCAWKNPDGTITTCDTPYSSFSPEKGYKFNIDNVLDKLKETQLNHIVITGGEPTLQHDLNLVVGQFSDQGYFVTVETNGTRYQKLDAFMSLSPKLVNSYHAPKERDRILHERNNHTLMPCKDYMKHNDYQFKFVGNDQDDLEEILEYQSLLNIPNDKIYIMPQGITEGQLKERQTMITDYCIEHSFNYANRLHIELWGNTRGT